MAEHDDLDNDETFDAFDNSVADDERRFNARRKLLIVNPNIIRCRKDRKFRIHY